MFNSLSEWFSSQKTNLTDSVARFNNRKFMDAAMAGCAMVAAADGSIDSDEKQKVAGFIRANPAMQSFDMKQCIERFTEFAAQLEFDVSVGSVECLKAVGVITEADQAKTLVHLCVAIGAADGDFDDDEKKVVKSIVTKLGLSPAEFGLS